MSIIYRTLNPCTVDKAYNSAPMQLYDMILVYLYLKFHGTENTSKKTSGTHQ